MSIEEENSFPSLGIKISNYKHYHLVTFPIVGDIDLYNCNELKDVFNDGNDKGIKDWVLDLSLIKFIDSSGLGVLANQAMLLKKTDTLLTLFGLQKTTKHLFTMPGLTKLFKVINDLNEL